MNVKYIFRTALLCLLAAILLCACAGNPQQTDSDTEDSSAETDSDAASTAESTSDVTSSEPPREAAYMEYEIPENYNDAYTDTFAENLGATDGIDYKPMRVVYSEASGIYSIYYDYPEGGSYMTQLVRKRWGMYMLGAVQHTDPAGVMVQIIGASTDFEWVLRCGPDSGSSGTFRGGNHGDYTATDWTAEDTTKTNDHFIDMTFYDGKTGEKLEPKDGETLTANGLRVVIHNNIYAGEYTQENVMINVEKLYLFNGEDVFVESKLYMTRNVYFQMSYTCMMPIMKQYGNWAKFYNTDGTEKLVQTPLVGTSNYGNNFNDGNNACKVEMWGEQAPAYHMTMQIYNPDDQFYRSTDYVKLWDMNPSSNKLYFSSFALGTPSLVKKGTEWTFVSSWSFSYQPDFVSPTEPDEQLGF